jgi:5-methyltetrahydrofolate--homocysteine methyltransferase
MTFNERLASGQPIIIDGAMGTLLFQEVPNHRGPFELLNTDNPSVVANIHAQYFEAGAHLVETNTFGASRIKLDEFGLGRRCEEINEQGASLAKKAAAPYNGLVAGSAGPTGKLVEPMGDFPAEEIYQSFAAQFRGLERGGADVIVIETMNDIQEARLALLAAKEATSLPVLCSMTFEENGKTMTGTDMVTAFATLAASGADVIGANCSMGPEGLLGIFEKNINAVLSIGLPVSVWSNAGLPSFVNGETVYSLGPDEFAALSRKFAHLGLSVIGGCCGTTPRHIAALARSLSTERFPGRTFTKTWSRITSRSASLDLSQRPGLILVGERLNPTARKKFSQDLREGKQSFLRHEAPLQVEEGASILDINVGVPGIDEVAAMAASVSTLSGIVGAPLMIDSDNSAVLEKALLLYPGIPVINSINGKKQSLKSVLPLLKRFGCYAVALCLDDSGIHRSAEKRIQAGERLLGILSNEGINADRIFIDPLILAESAEPGAALETLRVIEHFSSRGIKTSIGLSNISFGLPQRKHINNVFLRMALKAGLTAAIVNPSTVELTASGSDEETMADDFLQGRDPGAVRYIAHFAAAQESKASPGTTAADSGDPLQRVFANVVQGNSDDIEDNIRSALKGHGPDSIMNQGLLRGLEKVGDLYSSGEYFLPQMISSAAAMKKGFALLKPLLSRNSGTTAGTVVICTVRGDIHDIGKNIVAMMLENHGFTVHDLGKDVAADDIVAEAQNHGADIICLSSLLTTTMGEMKTVSDLVRAKGLSARLLVGGAVVTDEYARSIGAVYGRDAVDGVARARELLHP